MPGERREKRRQIISPYIFLVLLMLFLDQVSKVLISGVMSPGQSVVVVPGLLRLTLLYNTGAAFGIMRGFSSLFAVIAVISIITILLLLKKGYRSIDPVTTAGLCLVVSGAMGNLADRIRLGHVIDFVDLMVWPVFNIADSCITAGALILGWKVLTSIRGKGA